MADVIMTPSSDSGSGALAIVLAIVLLAIGGFAWYGYNDGWAPAGNTEINVTAPQAPVVTREKETVVPVPVPVEDDKPDTTVILNDSDNDGDS